MAIKVVDASAFGALVFGEPKSMTVAETLGEGPLAAPSLLWYELSSICLKKRVSHPELDHQILNAFHLARRIHIKIYSVDHSEVIDAARETGMTAYDASYMWLAKYLNAELVTLDKSLKKAADRFIRAQYPE